MPELVVYMYRRLTAKTRLEKEKALSKVHIYVATPHGYYYIAYTVGSYDDMGALWAG